MQSEPHTVDVTEIIEGQKLGWFVIRLVLVCWLVTFFDGYDQNVIAYAAPYIAPAYHLDKVMMGEIFSAGTVGNLVGGFLFGYIADRIGRRATIILATATFALLTLCLAFAQSYVAFMALRFLNGIALGGAIPLTWALSMEYVPRRFRATIVTLVMLGYSLGFAVGGPLSIALIPRFGWLSVFLFGGGVSLVAAFILFATLPESLRFLAATRRDPKLMVRIIRRLAPEVDADERSVFVVSDEARTTGEVRNLFRGELGWITPLLWTAFIASSLTTYFFTYWGPTVYESVGFSREASAWITSSNSVAGATGGLLLMRFTDRFGPVSVASFPALAVPLLLVVGFASMSATSFVPLVFLLSIFLNGGHYGITSITGLFYPTAYRGLGTGWAASMAKIGSIAGPLIGGYILSSSLPPRQIFAVMAVCPAVLCLSVLAIGSIQRAARVRAAANQREFEAGAVAAGAVEAGAAAGRSRWGRL
jgi:MFS transporter, AAHS family, 4-hydroxybenzoate transporter